MATNFKPDTVPPAEVIETEETSRNIRTQQCQWVTPFSKIRPDATWRSAPSPSDSDSYQLTQGSHYGSHHKEPAPTFNCPVSQYHQEALDLHTYLFTTTSDKHDGQVAHTVEKWTRELSDTYENLHIWNLQYNSHHLFPLILQANVWHEENPRRCS